MNSRSASAVVVSVLGAVACIAVLAFLAACGGGGSSSPDEQFGRMTLRVTDSPVTSAKRVVVEFTGVEVKARDGIVIAVLTEGDQMSSKVADHVIEVPETSDLLGPILSVVPLQLLSYHIAVRRGCDVDQPRNLAKSVTVE